MDVKIQGFNFSPEKYSEEAARRGYFFDSQQEVPGESTRGLESQHRKVS